ncbi:hypothetical protein [Fischerella thermalis]|uniref:hypothetical protein n=1 Tax=Fischerella thermalis TaxID=372787 RepID=UPI00307E6A24
MVIGNGKTNYQLPITHYQLPITATGRLCSTPTLLCSIPVALVKFLHLVAIASRLLVSRIWNRQL